MVAACQHLVPSRRLTLPLTMKWQPRGGHHPVRHAGHVTRGPINFSFMFAPPSIHEQEISMSAVMPANTTFKHEPLAMDEVTTGSANQG